MKRGKAARKAVLIGFMGAGKSAVGKALADRLDAEFIDIDERIEKNAGKSIRDIFASLGEGAFREMEKAAIRDAVSASGRVVAAGGGAFLDAGNRNALSAYAPVFFLDVSAETVLQRLSGDRLRPLFPGDKDKLRAMMEARRPAYLLADFIVQTDGRSIAGVAERILDLLAAQDPAHREGKAL